MKAAILNRYDKNGCDLMVRDIPVPEIHEQEVLVKIHTAGVNPLDNMIIRGEVKMIIPYTFPLVMGNEFVGTVEKVAQASASILSGTACMAECRFPRSAPLQNLRRFTKTQSPMFRSICPMRRRLAFL